MHSPERFRDPAIRAALWLVIDLIDDAMESQGLWQAEWDALQKIRGLVLDMLTDLRRIELRRTANGPLGDRIVLAERRRLPAPRANDVQ